MYYTQDQAKTDVTEFAMYAERLRGIMKRLVDHNVPLGTANDHLPLPSSLREHARALVDRLKELLDRDV